MKRLPFTTDAGRLFKSTNGEALVVLIHGLGGNANSDYWGGLPVFLGKEQDIGNVDILFYEYASTKELFPNLFALWNRSKRIAAVRDVADAFATTLETNCKFYGYKKLLMFGHSLGGHIAIQGASSFAKRSVIPVAAICMNGSPTDGNKLARLHTMLSFGGNPQIRFLSDRAKIVRSLTNDLSALRKQGVTATYIHNSLDELIPNGERGLEDRLLGAFDHNFTVQASHHWFQSVSDRHHSGYQQLIKWIKDSQ